MDDTNNDIDSMSAEEQAYFDSNGETAPAESDAPKAEETEDAKQPTQEETPGEDGEEEGADEQQPDQQRPQGDLKKALAQERQRRKESQAKARQLETDLAKLNGRFEVLERLARGEPASEQKPAPVDPENNPIEFIKAQAEKINRLEQTQTQADQQAQIAQQRQQIVNAYQERVTEYAQEVEDFADAYQFLIRQRQQELQALGFTGDALRQAIENNELEIVIKSFQDGADPAERIYNLAKIRGYQKAAPQVNVDQNKIETMKRAETASKSLSAVPGSSAKATPTLDALLKMSDDEFAAATSGKKFEEVVASLSR